jgi:CheY-like chemotaxis protein
MDNPPVLYVEDDENDVFFMRWAFEQARIHAQLKVARNGKEATDYLAGRGPFADRSENPLPCVIILDLNLPLMSGFDVLQWAREQADLKSLPVVIFTSSDQPQDREKAEQLHADEFVTKPSNPQGLTEFVRHFKERWLNARPPASHGDGS